MRTSTTVDRAGDLAAHGSLDRLLEIAVEREPEIAAGHRVEPARLVDEVLGLGAGATRPRASTTTFSQPRVPRR